MTSDHNAKHLTYCEVYAAEQLARWRLDHPGQTFTVEQVVADITEDQRSIYILIHSIEGAGFSLRATFDEVLFDYDAFSRRDWSKAIRGALDGAETA